jgi:glyoxylase-like metal-dependent hydrolase (beta-lactamase superfamily II)
MFRTIDVGSAQVTLLNIVEVERTNDQVAEAFSTSEKEIARLRGREPLLWSFSLSLFAIGGTHVLVDTGFTFADTGEVAPTRDLMGEVGVAPAQIDQVLITHCHGDHVGGLCDGEAAAFPAAELVIGRKEYDHWTNRSDPDGTRVAECLSAYEGRIRLVDDGDLVAEGGDARLFAVDAAGHTPGQIVVFLDTESERFAGLADIVHAPFQLGDTSRSPRFDGDPERAVATRRELLSRVAREKRLVHFCHFAFPGLGYVSVAGDGFAWRPVPRER